jgi:hypothetical protein
MSTLRLEVRSAVEGLRVGQISPVAQVATGFAVLQVVEDLPGSRAAINPASLAAISAVGSVKFVPDIGGLPEAEALLRDFPKPETWSQDPRTICQVRQDSLASGQQLFENFFAPANDAARKGRPAFEMMQAHLGLAQILAYQGAMTRAVEQYDQAYQIALANVSAAAPQVGEMLGVAYLHKAGMDSGNLQAAQRSVPGSNQSWPRLRKDRGRRAGRCPIRDVSRTATRRCGGAVAAEPRLHGARHVARLGARAVPHSSECLRVSRRRGAVFVTSPRRLA